jgi:hypothetical protein
MFGKLLGLATIMSVLLVACAPGAKLQLELFFPYTPDSAQLFNRVDSYEVKLSGTSLKNPDGETMPLSPGTGAIPLSSLDCKEGSSSKTDTLEIQVVAKDSSAKVIASGKQVLFRPCGKEGAVQILLSAVETFAPLSRLDEDSISQPANLNEVRAGHRTTFLPDGRLLITGGAVMSGPGAFSKVSKKTEIYNPSTGQFIPGPDMSVARAFHTATLVGTKVIVTGGVLLEKQADDTVKVVATNSVDVFEINTEGKLVRSSAPELKEARAFHSATVTQNNNLFLYGGFNTDAATGKYTMNTVWEVLVSDGQPLSSGKIEDKYQRAWHADVRAGDYSLLLIGGMVLTSKGEFTASKTILKATLTATDSVVTFSEETPMKNARAGLTATLIGGDSYILLVGGMVPDKSNMFLPFRVQKNVELLNGLGVLQSNFSFDLVQGRVFHSTNQLADGRIVVFGGLQSSTAMADRTELLTFDPNNPTNMQATRVPQRKDRFYNTGTILLNDSLLILGGTTIDTANSKYVTLLRGELFVARPSTSSP